MKALDWTSALMGIAFGVIWASAFTTSRIIVFYAPPLTSLTLRFFIAGIAGVLIARALGQNWHLTRQQWKSVVIFGFCQNGLYLGLNFVGMQTVEASLASIIASSMPLLVALAGWLVFREKIRPLGAFGLIAGMIGVGLIMGARLQGGADPVGVLYCVIGAVSLAIATLAVRGTGGSDNVMMIVGLQMFVGCFALLPPAFLFEDFNVVWSWQLIVSFFYQVFVPGLLATLIWFQLVRRIGTVRASVYHFLTPFFGVAIAAALLGEALGGWDVIGVMIITIGILAVQMSKQNPTRT
jgi:drug/metabolite transporter (DMT)-like permease